MYIFHRLDVGICGYCWCFRNPVNSPVEVASASHYLHARCWFIRISEASNLWRKSTNPSLNIPRPPQKFHGFIARPIRPGAPRWLRPGPSNRLAVDLMISGFRSWPTWRSPLRRISLTSFPVPLASCSMRKADSVEPGGRWKTFVTKKSLGHKEPIDWKEMLHMVYIIYQISYIIYHLTYIYLYVYLYK